MPVVFDAITVVYFCSLVAALGGMACWWAVELRHRHGRGRLPHPPSWVEITVIAASLLVALTELAMFVGRWGFGTGLSCLLWFAVAVMWTVLYRWERRSDRKDS